MFTKEQLHLLSNWLNIGVSGRTLEDMITYDGYIFNFGHARLNREAVRDQLPREMVN